jgi:hypothetical protein
MDSITTYIEPHDKQTVIFEFWRCEWDRRYEMLFTEEAFEMLVDHLKKTGLEVVLHESPGLLMAAHSHKHKLREVLTAVHEVQGLKWEEGTDSLPAIESLLAKYLDLRDGK